MSTLANPIEIAKFWWDAGPSAWFRSDPDFDSEIRQRFLSTHEAAANKRLEDWQSSPHGAFALLLLLDQFPRNMFRQTARAFATDAQAVEVAEAAIEKKFDSAYPPGVRSFFYMPFMHVEDMALQERCVDLCRILGEKDNYHYALIHLDVIRRFGRFPHRNEILGRPSTEDEESFQASGGFSA